MKIIILQADLIRSYVCAYILLLFFVVHNSVQMTILFPFPSLFFSVKWNYFHVSLPFFDRTTDEVYDPWCLSSRSVFLGVLRSNFFYPYTQRSPTFE